jgi:tRNA/tmRNA/rRNA uracil-C5-methylase (TrmA/RlmC/RlmD family)
VSASSQAGPPAAAGAGSPAAGEPGLLRLAVGPVAHGGHCVARHEGRVVFVRHALPGEVVLARLTGGTSPSASYWRADAVEVLEPSPDRVAPPCPLAHPGGCGGCDWQHVSPAAQRGLKAAVVTEQLERLAGLSFGAGPGELPPVVVEVLPGPSDGAPDGAPDVASGLGWRTRVRFAVDDEGRPGYHPHRSHDVVPVEHCPIADPRLDALGVGRVRWRGAASIDVASPAEGDPLVVVAPAKVRPPRLAAPASVAVRDAAPPGSTAEPSELTRVHGRTWVSESVLVDGVRRSFRVTGTGFWQVHPGAPQALLDAVLEAAAPRPGERALDLYSGVGLFAAGLAARVGADGSVVAVESDRRAAADARRSLHDLPQVRFAPGRVGSVLPGLLAAGEGGDVVVLDPPRSGAGRDVVGYVARLAPRVVVYVACDPAALARDVATAAGLGYRLTALRAFDAFPMTHHVECVATLEPAG